MVAQMRRSERVELRHNGLKQGLDGLHPVDTNASEYHALSYHLTQEA